MSDWLNEELPSSHLPGRPRNKIVREVRAVLWRYLRSRPQFSDVAWRAAWEWAKMQTSPRPEEIATQYIAAALIEMKSAKALMLPRSTSGEHRNVLLPR